jgi:D-alanyl-D-alanine carboxypeptidase
MQSYAKARGSAPPTGNVPVFEWILLDAETGQVLSEQNADIQTSHGALTGMMTLYLTFEAIKIVPQGVV